MSYNWDLAATEVLTIIDYMKPNEKKQIAPRFIKFLEERAINSYKVEIDFSKPISEAELSKETKSLLAVMYKQFLCNEEEKREFNNILRENEEKFQEEMTERYNSNGIFKDKKQAEIEKNDSVSMVKYKENIFNKMVNKVKQIFKLHS